MIVLKILLYILLAVLGIILLVLITPAGGEFSYIDGKLSYKVKLWIINLMDSDGGGLYNWWKKRKANKKDKPSKSEKPKKDKPVKEKKAKKKKQREQYEWEKELEDIPVNDPEADMLPAETAQQESAQSAAEEAPRTDSFTEEMTGEEAPEKKKKDKKKKKKKDEDFDEDLFDEDDDSADKSQYEDKKSVSDKIEFIVGIWESAQRPLLKIFKGFKLKDLYIDFIIADEDAYDCAMKYGRYSALVYNGIAFFSQLFTVRLKTIDVHPQFGVSKGRWDAAGKLSFRLGTVVIAGAWFLMTYIFRSFIPGKLRKRKLKKSAARQK
ncbi:hypothetical protein [Ruminococcus flavefaciens]|uniref:hypothetical protein n=1 Tax=Ruminococcus flavefaciens TaxID=1265 RepID=UPI00049089D8|nr:hypothetical protein [Ruminococcus flavefaciens]